MKGLRTRFFLGALLVLLAACAPVTNDGVEAEVVLEGKISIVYTLCNHGHRVYVYKAGFVGGIAVVPGACARGE